MVTALDSCVKWPLGVAKSEGQSISSRLESYPLHRISSVSDYRFVEKVEIGMHGTSLGDVPFCFLIQTFENLSSHFILMCVDLYVGTSTPQIPLTIASYHERVSYG
jgi:hypothetical protein